MKKYNRCMEEKKTVTLCKVPLEGLIAVLEDLWARGADYIDIIGIPNEPSEQLSLVIKQEYVCEEGFNDEGMETDSEDFNINPIDLS